MSSSSAVGRPRDPDVDRRITDAAITVFGELGWEGFSVEAVARRAGVGKASIYLRWPAKKDLLLDAVQRRVVMVSDIPASTVRAELRQLAGQLMASYSDDSGRAMLRLRLEAGRVPGLGEHWEALTSAQVLAARAIVRRAIERGEIPARTSTTMLLDTLCGAAMMHVQSVPAQLREVQAARADEYTEQLVDFVLAAVRATS